ncbi:hypothetical protein P7H12_00045 [Paenibacillus larvae]|nr:hypothetical protein [Paenibacillus larvae]MDT2262363.1 hypothetical protein [Paenibacillus larvae]
MSGLQNGTINVRDLGELNENPATGLVSNGILRWLYSTQRRQPGCLA